jgi:GR25 family glycosyltransferase involved in LPS biosynthesis
MAIRGALPIRTWGASMNVPQSSDLDLRSASTDDLIAWRDRIVSEATEHAERSNMPAAISALQSLELATIDEKTLEMTDPLLPQIADGRTVVATFDPTRVPAPDEVVIIYGNYPHAFANVVVNNPIKRHIADFWNFDHGRVEYDARWDGVDRILIINVDGRVDRWDSTLRELASARAPFQRIERVSASEPDTRPLSRTSELIQRVRRKAASKRPPAPADELARRLACLRSFTRALQSSLDAELGTVLILQDDFSFTSDLEDHLTDLQTFLQRGYDYWICLIATSKYGPVIPVDDLVAQSFQECTNAAGHLVSPEGRAQLIPVYERAAKRLIETGDSISNAADRCWTVLQPSGKFLVFRKKFGFQSASFSDIDRRISRYLD